MYSCIISRVCVWTYKSINVVILACPFKCEAEDKCISSTDVCNGYANCYTSQQDEKDCGKNVIFHNFKAVIYITKIAY